MNFIKVGKSFINLDNVTEVRVREYEPDVVDVYFGGVAAANNNTLQYNVTGYDGAEAEALLAWLNGIATDVVEQRELHERAERSRQMWEKFTALAFAHGTAFSDEVQPSFPGARERAAYALSVTDGVRAEFLVHAAQCGIDAPDEDHFADWQRSFVSGVLSA